MTTGIFIKDPERIWCHVGYSYIKVALLKTFMRIDE
jgi:hypothetical protein